MGMPTLFMLLILNPLNSLLAHPPRDFASLLDPAAVLQTMNVQASADALIAVLNAPPDPNSPDLYVKKLMAIRLLEQRPSAKAMPALETTAKGTDVTLRDAALEAIAAIGLTPSPRPTGAALLKELARSVPPDAGFVVALDLERDSSSLTARARMENALREFESKAPANAAAGPAAQQMRQGIGAMLPMFEQGIAQGLAVTGNLRVDAALLVLPPEMGAQPNENYIRCAIKGLYDPRRIGALLERSGDFEKRETAGHAIYTDKRGEMEICLLDPNTFVVVILNKTDKAGIMQSFLAALTAAEKGPAPKALAQAFDMVTESRARLAVAGAFSPAQKKSFAATLVESMKSNNLQLGPAEQIAFSGSQMLLNILQAQAYAASLDTQGRLAVHVVCPDGAAAAALNDSSNKLQKTLFDMVSKEAAGAKPPFDIMLRDAVQQGSLWKTETAESTVTIKVDNLLTPIMAMTMIGMPVPAPAAPAARPAPK